jgi:ribosomal protein S18 acetylase RimI-like enzyme
LPLSFEVEELRVRKARLEDIEEINTLTTEMHNHLGRLVGIEFTRDDLEEEFFSESDLDCVYVAEVDGKVVGYVSFSKEVNEDEWCGRNYRLEHLIVNEKHRRKGYGTKLVRALVKKAQMDEANVVTDTFPENKGTIEFYKSLGFKPFNIIFLLDREKRLKLNDEVTNL